MQEPQYSRYFIPKKNGKFRAICAPSEALKEEQYKVLELLSPIEVSVHAHGFVPGRSLLTNARPHRGKRYVLNLDLKDFFPSLSSRVVMESLSDQSEDLRALVEEYCFLDGALPQGAPTSPTLSNIVMRDVDTQVFNHSSYTYTRYADDMTFSGDDSLKGRVPDIISFVNSLVNPLGLRLNKDKVKLMPYYQRQVVTGIVVNNEKLTLSRKDRSALYEAFKDRAISSLDSSELGILNFLRQVDECSYLKIVGKMKKEMQHGDQA